MRRRQFVTSAVTGVAAFAGSSFAGKQAWSAASSTAEVPLQHAQSEEGVKIHPHDSPIMRGFPPAADQMVTPDSYQSCRDHLVWAHQHMSQLCTTQPISRGSGNVCPLPRRHREIDDIAVTGSQGTTVRLIDLLRESHTDAFLILHDGEVLTEQYFSGMRPDTRHQLWSASKSISMGVVFPLLQSRTLEETAPVTDYLPELAGTGYDGATIRHLMDMQSGVQYDYFEGKLGEEPFALNVSRREGGRHFRASGFYPRLPDENRNEGQYTFFQTLRTSENRSHGGIFYYKCCDTAVLVWACERVTGRGFADLLSDYVWSRLGAERDAVVVSDVEGGCTPNAGISVTLRDLARWGQMHAQYGNWNGQQIVPRESIEDVQRNHDPSKIKPESFLSADDLLPNTGYRSQFWIPGVQRDTFYAGGAFGQLCYVHPPTNTVIVRFATEDPAPGGPNWGMIMPRAFSEVVAALNT
jgi:CubicO group peptidase (beta-lactamase class C family)